MNAFALLILASPLLVIFGVRFVRPRQTRRFRPHVNVRTRTADNVVQSVEIAKVLRSQEVACRR